MPVVDKVAQEFVGEVDVVAVAWRSSYEASASMASVLLPSGVIPWVFDGDESIFQAFEVPYQPVTVLVAQGKEVGRWLGAAGEDEIRAALADLSQY